MDDRSLLRGAVGGMERIAAARPLLNACAVPRGKHHDHPEPIPVRVRLRWDTGVEQVDTVELERWERRAGTLVRVRVWDPRVMTGAVWLSAHDVRPR